MKIALPFIAAVAVLALGACQQTKDLGGEFPDFNSGNYGEFTEGNVPGRGSSHPFYGPGVDRSMFQPVYFDFDRFDIRGDQMGKIDAVANHLRRGGKLIIAGHTDEIGTSEYNRVLGERRAQAVASTLIGMGVNPSSIETVSFGEDVPAEAGNHSLNRRAEFGVVR